MDLNDFIFSKILKDRLRVNQPRITKTVVRRMRLDYALYVVSVICFVLAGAAQAVCPVAPTSTAVMVILGLIFAGLGYWKRPKKKE
jgi:hypothetical protein